MGKLYRYVDKSFREGEFTIYLCEYKILRETPKGAWIDAYGEEKFCLSGSGKRYAHTTRELAYSSFKARKEMQHRICRARLNYIEDLKIIMQDIEGLPTKTPYEPAEYLR